MEVYLKWVMAAVKTEPVVYAPAPNPKSSEHSFDGRYARKTLGRASFENNMGIYS